MRRFKHVQQCRAAGLALLFVAWSFNTGLSEAAGLPLPAEHNGWSDLDSPNVDSGTFLAAAKRLTVTTNAVTNLELGSEFGPTTAGWHYGAGGTLGGTFSTMINVANVLIEPDGTVTNGGSVNVLYSNGTPGSVGDDYGIAPGQALLTGTVTEVLLDGAGDNTIDVLFSITGGALQNDNPDPDVGVFSTRNVGLLRFTGVATPADWSVNFSLAGANLHVYGVPEPNTMIALGLAAAIVGLARRQKR